MHTAQLLLPSPHSTPFAAVLSPCPYSDEIDKDGKTAPSSPESGALYWTSADCPSHQLTFHRSIPLREIQELLLGKDSQCFQSPVGHHAVDSHCFTIRCDSRQLDLECRDEVQITSWLLGLVNLMMSGQNRSLKVMDDTPSPIDHTRDSEELRPPPPAPSSAAHRRTSRFSVCPAARDSVSVDYRRASAAWMKAVNGDDNTPKATRPLRRGTVVAPRAPAPQPPAITRGQVEARVVAPFHSLQSSFTALRADMAALASSLSSDVTASFARLSSLAAAQSASHARALSALHAELGAEQRKRKALQNKVIDLQGNIRVYCRVRPTSAQERADGDDSVVDCLSDSSLIIHTPTAGPAAATGTSPPTGKVFDFDRVFDAASSQEEVYRDVAPFVQSCVDGYNVCVFAYGQTGSGKSHTMEGPTHDRGVNYRALNDLFTLTRLEEQKASPYSPYYSGPVPTPLPPAPNQSFYTVSVSCLEIYNETVVDLLVKKREQRPLDIKQGADGGVYVAELTEVVVGGVAEVTQLLQTVAYPNRHTSATHMNDCSSRSHCALFVRVVGSNPATEEKSYGKLVLIDLAGSERLNRSAVTGVGVKEAQCINQSLSALGNCSVDSSPLHPRLCVSPPAPSPVLTACGCVCPCVRAGINALQTKAAHVPYRNSKLTYLLSDCLGGNSKCLMCCQLSPSASSYGESVCSLGFALRARSVELGAAKRNVGGEEVKRLKAAVREERKERERWEKESARLKTALKAQDDQSKTSDDAVARLTRELRERERDLAAAKEREAEREREMERLREAAKRREKKRVEWPDTRRLASPDPRDQENVPATTVAPAPPQSVAQVPQLVADIEARMRPSVGAAVAVTPALLSPLRESTAVNKKRKDSPTGGEALALSKRRGGTDAAPVEPQPSLAGQLAALGAGAASPAPAGGAFPAFGGAAPQSHSRIGAALREKYQRKAAPPSAASPTAVGGPAGMGVGAKAGAGVRAMDVCVTPQSLCGAAASTVRFTSSSVTEAAASRKGGEGSRAGEARRLRSKAGAERPPSTPLVSHSRRGDWRA